MTIQQLIATLEQKVHQLYQTHSAQQDEKIFVKFDRTLFSENAQNVAFYLDEIQQTLNKIKTLDSDELNHYSYLAEHLLAQCTALSEALNRNSATTPNKKAEQKPVNRSQHSIHKLPPRERLEKYYEALEQLNSLYQQHRDLARTERDHNQSQHYQQLAAVYKQRRQKCQDAIDLLEEYLAFKEEQENQESNKNRG